MNRVLIFILLASLAASAQQMQRYDSFGATTASASGIGNLIQAIPGATLTVFNQPAVGVSCAGGGCVAATTYTNGTGATACGAAVPLTRPTATTCLGTADSQGNFGFWAPSGNYQYCIAATNLTTQCYNTTLGVGTTSSLNNIIYVDGVKFPNVAAALAGLPAIGGTVVVPPHYRETFTSTIQVGSGRVGGSPVTNAVTLQLLGDVILTCNVTGGNPCFKLGSGSGITGFSQSFGAPGNGAGQNAGSTIFVPSTANISSVIIPLFTDGTTQSVFVTGLVITAATNATVSGAAIDIQGAADQTYIENNTVIQFPGILLRFKGNTGVSGPCCGIVVKNNWLDAGATSGGMTTCQPLVIQGPGAASGATEGITFMGGSFTNACTGLPDISIDGLGQTNVKDIVFINPHLERDVANTSPWFKIRDAQNIAVYGIETTDAGSGASDLFNLSQSGAGLERAIHLQDIHGIATITNIINDTISSPAIVFTPGTYGQYIPDYRFTSANAYELYQYSAGNGYETFANADFQPGLRILDTTSASTNSPNFQLCDQAGPTCWNVRKNGTPLAFIAPSGGTLSIPDNASSFNLTTTIGTGSVTTAGTAVNTLTCQAQTGITVTGAATTDNVVANIGAALPATWQTGIVLSAHVTATNTVTVYLCNPTATATITPAATQVNVRVTR